MQRISHDKPCFDHQGNIFGNIKSMCAHWHVKYETFSRRINVYHMSLEDALTRPVKHNGGLRCSDHLGEDFRSISSMCDHWGIDRKVYEYRLAHNWSQEEALSTPPGTHKKKTPAGE